MRLALSAQGVNSFLQRFWQNVSGAELQELQGTSGRQLSFCIVSNRLIFGYKSDFGAK